MLDRPRSQGKIHNAWLKTLEDGFHTAEVASDEHTSTRCSTGQFAKAVIARLGQEPSRLPVVSYDSNSTEGIKTTIKRRPPSMKKLVGVDVFIHKQDISPDALADKLEKASDDRLEIKLITNRGVKVWPQGFPETFCTDHWRCRFKKTVNNGYTVTHDHILKLLGRIREEDLDFIKTENLCELDGNPASFTGTRRIAHRAKSKWNHRQSKGY